MKTKIAICLGAYLAVHVLLVLGMVLVAGKPEVNGPASSTPGQKETVRSDPRQVLMFEEQNTVLMDLDDYLVGVLLGEIPSDFHEEAKKAQAIVARTYTLRVMQAGVKHGPGGVCGDHRCCQAYVDPAAYLQGGGKEETVQLMRRAVEETNGLVLTYEGKLIDATYFSCSGGVTEDAVAVWGTDIPYLRSVSSPGEEIATHYIDTVQFSAQEFQQLLGLQLPGDPTEWFGEVTYTDGDGVDRITIGQQSFCGTELRTKLGLYSTRFTVTPLSDGVLITTRGFGHRVGMSQFGADAMARAGNTCEQILHHYYSGVTLEKQ